MGNLPNHRERRASLKRAGILKQKSKLPFNKWLELTRESIQRGREIHEANVQEVEQAFTARLEEEEGKRISEWRESGYNEKEIELLREAFALRAIKDKKTYQADKKEAKRLIAEAKKLKADRV